MLEVPSHKVPIWASRTSRAVTHFLDVAQPAHAPRSAWLATGMFVAAGAELVDRREDAQAGFAACSSPAIGLAHRVGREKAYIEKRLLGRQHDLHQLAGAAGG